MEFNQFVKEHLKVKEQKYVDMGGGFCFHGIEELRFPDKMSALNYALKNEGIWEVRELIHEDKKWGVSKVEILYIKFPEAIILNGCSKPEGELITQEGEYIGMKFIVKSCCNKHYLLGETPEEVKDYWKIKYDEAKLVKH